MNIPSSLKSTLKLAALSLATLATTSLTNCGGGGGGSDNTPVIRPLSLEDVTLALQGNNATFSFSRSSSSSNAEVNGATETGSFTLTSTAVRAPYRSIEGGFIDVVWPRAISSATYTYNAINDTAGEIILRVGSSTQFDLIIGPIGTSTPDHFYLDGTTPTLDGTTPSSARMIVSFSNNNGNASLANIRIEDPNDPRAGTGSSTSTTQGVFTVNGTPLPLAHNVDISNRPSRLSLERITGSNLIFIDSTDPANNFTLIPTATALTANNLETGESVFLDNAGVQVTNAVDYTYTQISGGDSARLTLASGVPLSGSIILNFTSSASSTSQAAGSFTSSSGRSGTFTVSSR